MGVISAILMIFIVVFGFFFIYYTVKVDKLDSDARDRSSEIDGTLWDRAFQLSKLVEILDKKEIEHEIEVLNVNAFGLGMSPVLQATNCEALDNKDRQLRKVMKEHPELMEDEDFKTHLEKFNIARAELMQYSIAYNKSVNKYNAKISSFPANLVALFHKKKDKSTFMYFFANIEEKE